EIPKASIVSSKFIRLKEASYFRKIHHHEHRSCHDDSIVKMDKIKA
ncbi:35320_t:CDS:1, partial [Racocetra persica]